MYNIFSLILRLLKKKLTPIILRLSYFIHSLYTYQKRLLEEIYGDGCMSNLATLAKESDEARALLQGTAFQPFMEKVERTSMGIIFHTTPFKEQGPYFWKNVLRNVLHSAGRGMFGDKTITSFLERVLADTVKQGWLQCRKDYAVYLNDDGRVFILHPESFPWNKRDYYDCVGQGTWNFM